LAFLAGCGNQADKASNIPVTPKWKGAPYRIAFDTQPAKPNPAGVTIPSIKYTANPDALERRVSLVVKFDTSGATKQGPMANQMIMPRSYLRRGGHPTRRLHECGRSGAVAVSCGLLHQGKIKISVAIARSSLSSQATDDEVDAKRLSDWLPVEVAFKNPHPKC